jgi:phage baseplate assembly protein W
MVDFGEDLSCTTDLDPRCVTVTGNRLVGEAIFRRLTTPRGRLLSDRNYGIDIRDYINADMGPKDVAAMQSAIHAECMRDDRIVGCDVLITPPAEGDGTYVLTITLETGNGPFDLTLSVNDVTVALLSVT